MDNRIRLIPCALTATVVAFLPALSHAEPAVVDSFLTVRYSDNMAQRNDDDAEADVEYRPGIRISHIKDPGQCNSALDAELAYLVYQESTLDDQTSANLGWAGDCEITPHFNWRASNTLRESAQDTRGTNTVENRERRNVFSTGPQLIIPLTDVDTFSTSLDWRKSNFEENTENNSERWVANARLQRNFSPIMQGWLSANYSDADFDGRNDLQVTSYRVGASRQISRTLISGDFGISTLERDGVVGDSEEEGTVWSLRASHDLDNANVYVSFVRELTDIASDTEIAFGDIRFNFTQSQAVELTTLTTGGSMALENGYDVNASFYAQEYAYIGADLVEDIYGTTAGVSKELNSQLSANFRLGYERQEFDPSGGSADEYSGILGLSYQRTRDLSFALDIGHETQETGDSGIAEFSENWVAATVTYNLR